MNRLERRVRILEALIRLLAEEGLTEEWSCAAIQVGESLTLDEVLKMLEEEKTGEK